MESYSIIWWQSAWTYAGSLHKNYLKEYHMYGEKKR